MSKIILCNRPYGWSVTFYGVVGMPEDVEMPLPFTRDTLLMRVAQDMANRFPNVRRFYRDTLDHVSHCAW